MMVKVVFDSLVYNPFIRKQQFDMIDFFSYFGGLLGLFAGISVLSIFEVIFRTMIMLFRCKWKRSILRVRPFVEDMQVYKTMINKFQEYAKKFLEQSSINGLNYLLSGNIVQRFVNVFF